jgi:hypothetical protein
MGKFRRGRDGHWGRLDLLDRVLERVRCRNRSGVSWEMVDELGRSSGMSAKRAGNITKASAWRWCRLMCSRSAVICPVQLDHVR